MYSIELTEKSEQFIKKVSKKDAKIILSKIYSLRDNPFRFLKRLKGQKLWRLRVSDYRAIADVIVSGQKIIIIRIGHIKNIYD